MKYSLSIIFTLIVFNLQSQNITLTFGESKLGLDSIYALNQTTGQQVVVPGKYLYLNSITNYTKTISSYQNVRIWPNPFENHSNIEFQVDNDETIEINIFNSLGQKVIYNKKPLKRGTYKFVFYSRYAGTYIVQIKKGKNTSLSKLLCLKGNFSKNDIDFAGSTFNNDFETKRKSDNLTADILYTPGDRFLFRCYYRKRSTIITDIPLKDTLYTVPFYSCIDADSTYYPVVVIGTQKWMAENLSTTKYRNGDFIGTTVPATLSLYDSISPKYQWAFNGDENKVKTFGRLYTWHTLMDNRNVCPSNWHVPSKNEWISLQSYLIDNNYNYNQIQGNNIAKSMASIYKWEPSNEIGSIGNTDFPEYRNKSGFSALPSGNRSLANFYDFGKSTQWWTRSESGINPGYAVFFYLSRDNTFFEYGFNDFKCGLSVRCVRNELPKVVTKEPSRTYATISESGGEITFDGGTPIAEFGVCWSVNEYPTILDFKTSDTSKTFNYISNITGLNPNTTYYIRAYATNSTGTSYGEQYSITTGSGVADNDGNIYNLISIGSQVWMKENLKTTKFNDNTTVNLVTDGNVWDHINSPAYCYYKNDTANYISYGAFYNWATISCGKNICPVGWHVPSEVDWVTMENFLINNKFNYDQSTYGDRNSNNKLAKALAYPDYYWWPSSADSIGAVGNPDFPEMMNKTGFSALPSGYRMNTSGLFSMIKHSASWWTSNEFAPGSNYSYSRSIHWLLNSMNKEKNEKNFGLSIRCIKDPE